MSEPTEDMIKREIAAAAKILREDGHSVRLTRIEEKLARQFPDPPDDDPSGKPGAPPRKDPAPKPVRKSLWWGEIPE
jgi:hypothetical protein